MSEEKELETQHQNTEEFGVEESETPPPPSAVTEDSPNIGETTTIAEQVSSLADLSISKAPVPSDGIEILVKMAESGDIDAKNVDIIDVTDKFLKAIAAAPKENLRQSGKILFHASVLLRMKAEALLTVMSSELDGGDDFLDFDSDGALIFDSNKQAIARQITLQDLEKAIVRRTQKRTVRPRQVTLEQLIEALREAEKIEKERAERKPRARIDLSGYHQVNDVDDILDLAHDEDIEVTIARIEHILQEQISIGQKLELLTLIQLLNKKGDWVDAFLASLFLSNAGKIELHQSEFYGPLFLELCDPSMATLSMLGVV